MPSEQVSDFPVSANAASNPEISSVSFEDLERRLSVNRANFSYSCMSMLGTGRYFLELYTLFGEWFKYKHAARESNKCTSPFGRCSPVWPLTPVHFHHPHQTQIQHGQPQAACAAPSRLQPEARQTDVGDITYHQDIGKSWDWVLWLGLIQYNWFHGS